MYSSNCDDSYIDSRDTAIDEAVVRVSSQLSVSVWSQSTECSECSLERNAQVAVNQSKLLRMNTTFPRHVTVVSHENATLCDYASKVLVDQGDYQLNVSADGNCSFTISNSPINSNWFVLIELATVAAAVLLFILAKHLYKYRRGILLRLAACYVSTQHHINADDGTVLMTAEDNSDSGVTTGVTTSVATPSVAGSTTDTQRSSRVHSVDTLRGVSLLLMVFVNYGGGRYWYFRHSAWNGLTVADLVFPWFVFVMGTSIAVSFDAARRRAVSKSMMFRRILRRSVILFVLGLALSNHGRDVNVRKLRVFGVLQRLAVTYCVVAVVELLCVTPAHQHAEKWWHAVRELVLSWPLWLVTVCLLVVHTSLTFLLHVPHCPRGYVGPGGLHAAGKYMNCTGGAAGYIDRLILTPAHMYQHPTCRRVYECKMVYDPEGILGTMTSVVLCVLGVEAGKILLVYQTTLARNMRWISWALVTGVVGGALCSWSQEDGVIPVNKNLWSLSFILVLSSMAFLLIAMFYSIIDVRHWWTGTPFTYLGMNSIVIYLCHEVFRDYFPVQFYVANSHAAHLAVDIWGTAVWLCAAAYLYYKNIFIAI